MIINLVYTEGLEAIYINGKLELVDEIIDLENLISVLVNKTIMCYNVKRVDEYVFSNKYDYELPSNFSDFESSDFVILYH